MDELTTSAQSIDGNEYVIVTVTTPFQVLFSGPALGLSSTNSVGKFDIIPEHANFITIVEKQPIIIEVPNQKPVTFNFNQAIIYNRNNHISVYAEPMSVQSQFKF